MKVRKKRLEKFKQHAKAILTPYAKEIAEGNILKLERAINGIIYQYVGDEDCQECGMPL